MKILKPHKSQIKHLARHLRPVLDKSPEDSLAIASEDGDRDSSFARTCTCRTVLGTNSPMKENVASSRTSNDEKQHRASASRYVVIIFIKIVDVC